MFKISRLITTPNPGTNSLPLGTCGCDVVGVVPLDVVGGGADWGCVFVLADEAVAGAVVVSAVGAGEAGVLGASGGGASAGAFAGDSVAISGGGSGASAGGWGAGVGGNDIGLAGLTGLLMFVGFVTLFVHVFDVSVQGETTG